MISDEKQKEMNEKNRARVGKMQIIIFCRVIAKDIL